MLSNRWCVCRVKALKKDTPPKVIRTLSTQDSAKNAKKTAPSLFHPSNIQLSSTPKVNRTRYIGNRGDTGSHGDTVDLSKVLQEAYDTPVRGHRMRVSLSERRKQQRELQKQQANGANVRNRSVNLAKSFEPCDSGQPLVANSGGNWSEAGTSHSGSSSGSGCGKQGARGETHPPSLMLKERRLLTMMQGKSADARLVTERVSSPGSSPGSQSSFSRHASRHIKPHDVDLGDYDGRQKSGEAQSADHANTSASSYSPKTTNEIFDEHKEIMSHLNLVIGRARAVMTKATNRKHVDPVDAPTEGATEPITDAPTRVESNDASKSTSVRRKLAWDNDSQASCAVAGESTAPENGSMLLPAWATRESVIIKQSLDDISLPSNMSDLSVTSCEMATNSAESVSKYNFQGAALGGVSSLCFQSDVSKRDVNRINSPPVKRETWPQPGRVTNDERDGEAKDCGKFSDGEAKDCGKFSDGEAKDCGKFSDDEAKDCRKFSEFNMRAGVATDKAFCQGREEQRSNDGRRNHSNEASVPNDSSPIVDDMSVVPRSYLPMGNNLLKVLEQVKMAHRYVCNLFKLLFFIIYLFSYMLYWNGQLVWTPVAGNMSRRSATMTSDPSHT